MSTEEKFVRNPAWSRTEAKLWKALWSLKLGKPSNPELAKAAEQGRLRVNFLTVSLEAACSRTLINTVDCAYPDVRQAILDIKGTNPLILENRRLKDEVAALTKQIQARDSLHAEILARARKIEKGRAEARLAMHNPSTKVGRAADMRIVGRKLGDESDSDT